MMRIAVRQTDLFVINLRTRLPFRYGIATMAQIPHLLIRAVVEINGRSCVGISADHLPPKWFTKNPASSYREEVTEMLDVIRHACDAAQRLPPAVTVFDWWCELLAMQQEWAAARGYAPLLFNFGVSLLERSVIDAACRATRQSYASAVRENTFGIELGEIHLELGSQQPASLLPAEPLRSITVRHTIGQLDPLTATDLKPADRIDDGLPQTLEEYIAAQGLTHFKIKLAGSAEADRERLRAVLQVLDKSGADYAFTVDGNENFDSVADFRALWETLLVDAAIAPNLDRLIFVEQPFHRDIALTTHTADALLSWEERPALIIDESDDSAGALPTALESGYAGGSHKNCKGVFRGIANACLIEQRSRISRGTMLHMSAEDLANTGPVALLQDFAVVATLGIPHAERNGHHYFAGLSQFPRSMQEALRHAHGDLYAQHPLGFAAVEVRQGQTRIGSVVDAPFGVAVIPDFSYCTRLDDWTFDSLEAGTNTSSSTA